MVKLMIGLLKRVKNSIKYSVRYPGLIIASTARVSSVNAGANPQLFAAGWL